MQVQTISNSNNKNFTGRVEILGDLSYNPCRYVRKAYNSMQELIKDKPFDLFIKQNHKENTLNIYAVKSEDLLKKNKPLVQNRISTFLDDGQSTTDLYVSVAKNAVDRYENLPPKVTFMQKCSKFFSNLGKNFLKALQDKDEI